MATHVLLTRLHSQSQFLQYSVELWSTESSKLKEAARNLFNDWQSAKNRILTEITAKLSHYNQLPWKLLALAHHNRHVAAEAAKTCLKLWSAGGIGCHHRQSQRFLSPDFTGSDSDPPLVNLVTKMAQGADISDPEFLPLRQWLARFQCIKLCERSVEGTHAVITRSMKRGPNSGMGYLSIELRFRTFWETLSKDPKVSCLYSLKQHRFHTMIYYGHLSVCV